MPKWLSKQLMQAFRQKDRGQVRFLNRCWFTFIKKEYDEKGNHPLS
ncbi:cortex morphogenetic protein CmpA [Shimazuella kribbensis]|nr:cortex morphogenetic protein CmpA [Shimazuella kribbensis]